MMRSLFRGILVTLAAAALVFGVMAPAFANTELVPASRLIAPFLDISSGRDTFYLITNVSQSLNLNQVAFLNASGTTIGPYGVHLEHYGQSCLRIDESTGLTPTDIDQFDLLVNSVARNAIGAGQALGSVTASSTQSGVAGRGWTDIDVRRGSGTLTASTSVQANVLLGLVVITDAGGDFALAYPMASVIGTSSVTTSTGAAGAIGGPIVTRNAAGTPTLWTGRYEPLPYRLFVPAFFAEGTDSTGPNAGQTFSAFLAIAGPPDGNWSNIGNGEAPGQSTGANATNPNLKLNFIIYDGCEKNFSDNKNSHYLNNTYAALFGANTNRANWTTAVCGVAFGGRDELSQQAVGWIDITNTAVSCGDGAAGCPVLTAALNNPNVGVGQPRGMVGITIENVTATNLKIGDVTRLWGDPSPWGNPALIVPGSGVIPATCSTGVLPCSYSLVDRVNHNDTGQNGVLNNTNSM
jgi:hypothetical protein